MVIVVVPRKVSAIGRVKRAGLRLARRPSPPLPPPADRLNIQISWGFHQDFSPRCGSAPVVR